MPNSNIRPPYGDIFLASTPYLDKVSDRLYQEQKQREAYKQQQDKALDDEFSRSVAKIRDADVNEYVDKYQAYKQAKIGLMRMSPINNQKEYISAQLEASKKLADLSRFGNESIATKAQLEQGIAKPLTADKIGKYKDNAHEMVIQANRTPTSQLGNLAYTDENGKQVRYDPLNIDEYARHIDTKGVMDAIRQSTGTSNEYLGDKAKPSDLQIPKIKASNNPVNFYETMKLAATKNPRDFLNTLPQPSDEDYFNAEKQYNNLDPNIRKMWKMDEGKDLPSDDEIRTPLEKALKYQAMTHALNPNNQPRITGYADDKEAITRNRQQFARETQKIGSANTAAHIRLAAGLRKEAKSDGDVESADAVLHNVYDIINQGEPKAEGMFGEHKENLITISDPNLLKAFATIRKAGTTPVPPDNVVVDKSKDQINLIYNDIPTTDASGKPDVIRGTTISMSGRDYVKQKVRETYPNKDIGQINNIVDKVISKGGGLYKTIQMYNPNSKQGGGEDVIKIKVNGKVLQGRKGDLDKLDNAKIKYEIIK